jgi:hypothetical protein
MSLVSLYCLCAYLLECLCKKKQRPVQS